MRRTRLIDARKATGKTQEQIAEFIGVDRTTLGKWERGESTPHPNQRGPYAEVLGVAMSALDSMLSGLPADQAEMPEWLTTYLAMEQSATALRAHEPRAVYGMLQTPRYVEHLAGRAGISGVSSSFVQRTIDQRLHRQKRVRNGDLQVEVIQPESALHLRVGDPSVMAEQLRTMAELADLPNVTVRITTYDAGQYEARRLGDFAIVTHPWGNPRVHVEGYKGGEFLTDQETVAYFMAALDDAERIALSSRGSRDFMLRLADSWSER